MEDIKHVSDLHEGIPLDAMVSSVSEMVVNAAVEIPILITRKGGLVTDKPSKDYSVIDSEGTFDF